jgi:hypothetical protein
VVVRSSHIERSRQMRALSGSWSVNVVVPYVTLHPELPMALRRENIPARYVDTSAPDGYWSLLASCWTKGETFIVLEADKFPEPGALRELWDCEQPWCTYPVSMRHVAESAPYPSLSCTKFDASLMAADPDLLAKVGELDLGFGEKEWSRLDMGVAAFCENISPPHWHEAGRIEHRH